MKNSYTTIYYKDQKISGIFAATLNNDFYDEAMLGATSILEESVPGRDIPYFYGISREPLEFEVTFAFSKPLDIYEIKSYTEMFYDNQTYQPLAFEREDGFITPVYYVLVTGEPEIEYMRTETNKYVGYFKINFRCNAPYGFMEDEVEITGKSEFDINMIGGSEKTDYYIMELQLIGAAKTIKIENTTTNTSFQFEMKTNETIEIDGRNKRVSSTQSGIYTRWENLIKHFIIFTNGINNMEVTEIDPLSGAVTGFFNDINVKLIYRMPRYI